MQYFYKTILLGQIATFFHFTDINILRFENFGNFWGRNRKKIFSTLFCISFIVVPFYKTISIMAVGTKKKKRSVESSETACCKGFFR